MVALIFSGVEKERIGSIILTGLFAEFNDLIGTKDWI
jgi:hypothetical protein